MANVDDNLSKNLINYIKEHSPECSVIAFDPPKTEIPNPPLNLVIAGANKNIANTIKEKFPSDVNIWAWSALENPTKETIKKDGKFLILGQHFKDICFSKIHIQSKQALKCYSLSQVSKSKDRSTSELTMKCFANLEHFLYHAAVLSCLLWNKNYGENLRNALNIKSDKYPNLKKRTFRNHLTHIDERLFRWHLESSRQNFISDNIGPLDSITGSDEVDRLLHYDPRLKVLYFWGDKLKIDEVAKEIKSLCLTQTELEKNPAK